MCWQVPNRLKHGKAIGNDFGGSLKTKAYHYAAFDVWWHWGTLNDLISCYSPHMFTWIRSPSQTDYLALGAQGSSYRCLRWWALVPCSHWKFRTSYPPFWGGARGYLTQTPITFLFISLFWRRALCGTCWIRPPGCEWIWLVSWHSHLPQLSRVT